MYIYGETVNGEDGGDGGSGLNGVFLAEPTSQSEELSKVHSLSRILESARTENDRFISVVLEKSAIKTGLSLATEDIQAEYISSIKTRKIGSILPAVTIQIADN